MGNVIRIIYIYFQLVVKASYDIQRLVDHLDCKLQSYFLIVAFLMKHYYGATQSIRAAYPFLNCLLT